MYERLCFCTKCNKKFNTLFEYGFHVFQKHRKVKINSITDFKKFVENEILKQLENIKIYRERPIIYQKKVFSLVKKKLKEETMFPLNLVLPDGKRLKIKN